MRKDLVITKAVNRVLSIVLAPFSKVWSFMRRVIPGLKQLPVMKPETLAAVLSFIFVLTMIIVHALIIFVWTPDPESKERYPVDLTVLMVLLFAIPFLLYWFIKLLLAPPKSRFPDIDLAFEAGLDAIRQHGISVRQAPIYLVLGLPDSRRIKQLMSISGRTFDFSHITADGQSLYWYGSNEGIFVFLSGVGNVCQLTKDLGKYVSQSPNDGGGYADADSIKGTIQVHELSKGKSEFEGAAGEAMADQAIKSTIKAGELAAKPKTPSPGEDYEGSANFQENRTQLSSREKLAEQKNRIQHFSSLLSRVRRPVCGLNGIVVTMANRLVEEFPGQLARQTKSDLQAITNTTGVISTVTAVVNGFETDEGCREFVDRLRLMHGDEFLKRRFGKSYRSWEAPTAAHLKEISNESIENFDQYVYSIFTQHDALSSQHVNGNRDMVKFLCWIYARFFEGLELTLSSGFNVDADDAFPRFAGCYFMGIGDGGSQFFGEGVFDRIEENQGELEWAPRIAQREETLSMASQLIFLLGLVAFIVFGFLLWRGSGEASTSFDGEPSRVSVASLD